MKANRWITKSHVILYSHFYKVKLQYLFWYITPLLCNLYKQKELHLITTKTSTYWCLVLSSIYLVQQRNQQAWVVHRRTARKILADERDYLVSCRVALGHTSNLLIVFLPETYFLCISSVYMNHL